MNNSYRIVKKPIQAKLFERVNRFACTVEMKGKTVKVYLPNSGRLEELLVPGSTVLLEKRRDNGKTNHDLLLVRYKRHPDSSPIWVGVDSRLPQHLLRWVIENRLSDQFGQPNEIQSEPRVGNGRFDLSFQDRRGFHLVETKSVNLLDASATARFPDTPITRGVRYIEELIAHKSKGVHPRQIFIVMHADPLSFSPFSERDPEFAQILQQAKGKEVNILAMKFDAGREMTYLRVVDVILPPTTFAGSWPDHAS